MAKALSSEKVLGSEIVEFHTTAWPEGHYCDESVLTVMDDGRILRDEDSDDSQPGLPLTDKYDLADFGMIINEKTNEYFEFSHFFNAWKKARTTLTLVVSLDREAESSFRSWCATNGVKLTSSPT